MTRSPTLIVAFCGAARRSSTTSRPSTSRTCAEISPDAALMLTESPLRVSPDATPFRVTVFAFWSTEAILPSSRFVSVLAQRLFERMGIGWPCSPVWSSSGQASCQRMSMASSPPTTKNMSPRKRNWMPMILWSMEKMYFLRKPISGWPWPLPLPCPCPCPSPPCPCVTE
jgi:hypothetical protein